MKYCFNFASAPTALMALALALPATASAEVAGTPLTTSHRQLLGSVTGMELYNTESNEKVADLVNGSVIDVRAMNLDANKLTIVATTEGELSRVRFGFLGQENFRTESSAPFSLCGDDGNGDYYNCQSLGLGSYNLVATPVETANGQATGVLGTPVTVSFQITAAATCVTEWTEFIVGAHYVDEDIREVDCGAPNALVVGMQCIDHYCDDLRLLCNYCEECMYAESSSYVTEVFSEEGEPMYCEADHFMTGLSCQGHYCDNLMMECTTNVGRTSIENECTWSEWMSEELVNNGTVGFAGSSVRGIECRGHFCDDKRFWICPAVETC